MTDKELLDKYLCTDKNGNKKLYSLNRLTNDELSYLQNRFTDSSSIKETFKRMLYGIEEKPKCPICGKPVGGLGKPYRLLLNTCLERYGHKNFGCNDSAKKKTKESCIKRYGSLENMYKEASLRAKQTKLERYGDENYVNIDKIRETCMKKYGVPCFLQSEERYRRKDEFHKKSLQTQHKNKTFVQSKAERCVYNILRKRFDKFDVICQYRSDKYPFACDFYIKSIDTYIEYNGHYTHGNHSFNETDENDIHELNNLQKLNKNHKKPGNNLYNTKIYVWTTLDPLKRKTASENNLNYFEFCEIDDAYKFIKQYESN